MEFFDIRDEKGNVTGQVKERSLVHRDGDIHGTSHVWLVRKNRKSGYDVLLQLRSHNKDAFPDCYDISSAGHLPAGSDYLESALRELEEELGITAEPSELQFLFVHDDTARAEFYGKPFINHEISNVYLLEREVWEEFHLQEEEVAAVKWIDYRECLQQMRSGEITHCVMEDEFRALGEYLGITGT